MSYVWRTRHPMVRRQQYLDKKRAIRKAYFKANPEEAARYSLSLIIIVVGISATAVMMSAPQVAAVTFIVTIALAILAGPKNLPR